MRTRTVETAVTVTGMLDPAEEFTAYIDRGRRRRPVVVDTVTVTMPRRSVSGRGFKVNANGTRSNHRVAVVPLGIEDLPATVLVEVEDQWRAAVSRMQGDVRLAS